MDDGRKMDDDRKVDDDRNMDRTLEYDRNIKNVCAFLLTVYFLIFPSIS